MCCGKNRVLTYNFCPLLKKNKHQLNRIEQEKTSMKRKSYHIIGRIKIVRRSHIYLILWKVCIN